MEYMILKGDTYESVSVDFVCGKTFVIIITEVSPWTGKVTIYLKYPK
jgi:hypothetical protein